MTPPTARVAVVITTFNHAHFLAEAIESALSQSHPADEIVLVDDGSDDDPFRIAERYPAVRRLRQANQGLAAARNAGLAAVASPLVVFLDADDRLLEEAIAAGVACFARFPGAGFVYGGHRRVTAAGERLGPDLYQPIGPDPYRDFLRGNRVGMHGTAMYHRCRLLAAGGFDAGLRRCEDYELYLRMSRSHAVASHPAIVAEYRWHGGNMSANHREMLAAALMVHGREAQRAKADAAGAEAWRAGRRAWRDYYAGAMLADAAREWRERRSVVGVAAGFAGAVVAYPPAAGRSLLRLAAAGLRRGLG
jgi:glycosyltransferase involved in cell wall biosynthesis